MKQTPGWAIRCSSSLSLSPSTQINCKAYSTDYHRWGSVADMHPSGSPHLISFSGALDKTNITTR